jgi:hypothetical protein
MDFKSSLPRQHTLTPQNTQAHISMNTSTPYALTHTVYSLCQIALHREYVPFLPIRCEKPQGPLDPPLFPSDKYDVPPDFWEDSARDCFKAARDIMDLVRSCQEWNVLVETPIIGFAIYTVSFTGVYCMNFPHMDPHGFMCTPKDQRYKADGSKASESSGGVAASKAVQMVGEMSTKLHMAQGWFKTINRMHKYFKRMIRDYKKNIAAIESGTSESESPTSTRHLSLREGGIGGGLDEFKLLERTLKDFGNLEDQDIEIAEMGQKSATRTLDTFEDSNSGTTVKSEDGDRPQAPSSVPQQPESGKWNAVNSAPGVAATHGHTSSLTPTTSAQFRTYDSYTQTAAPPRGPPQPAPFGQQLSGFRPTFNQDGNTGAPPSLTSPGSYSATTQSNPSPPFDRQHGQYGAWTPQNTGYPMQPVQQQVYVNGVAQQQMLGTAYGTPTSMQPPGAMPQESQPWNQMQKEHWLNNLDTRMSGDDFAAFVDGTELSDLAMRGAFGGGWLNTVWNGGHIGQ